MASVCLFILAIAIICVCSFAYNGAVSSSRKLHSSPRTVNNGMKSAFMRTVQTRLHMATVAEKQQTLLQVKQRYLGREDLVMQSSDSEDVEDYGLFGKHCLWGQLGTSNDTVDFDRWFKLFTTLIIDQDYR